MDVHINLDQSAQSEPRIRLQLAENLLRETQSLIRRLEVCNFPYTAKQNMRNGYPFFLQSNVFSAFLLYNVVFECLLG